MKNEKYTSVPDEVAYFEKSNCNLVSNCNSQREK